MGYIEITGMIDGVPTHTEIELSYPEIYAEAGKRTTLTIGMMHTRASQSIRISYESARDGWVIEQGTPWQNDHPENGWKEVAFIGKFEENHQKSGSNEH